MRKHSGGAVALILCATMMFTACSTAWIGAAEQIVAALIPAAANIIALVATMQGKTVSAADLQLIQRAGTQAGADLLLIQALIAQYQKADAASKPGILNQIQTAMHTVQANLNGLLPALHIQDVATQTKITAVIGILLSEVQSLAAIVPLVQAGAELPHPSTGSGQAVSQQTRAPSTSSGQAMGHPNLKAPLSASEFVASYNKTMTAKTGNADLDRATAGLQIHVHGKVARWSTAGLLK
jgi:hypothetical protein